MSLNGLDAPAIQEAYSTSITEAGGWFLLKYTSRDSVELLGRGKGGVHEARYAIAKYEDPSPLYGLLIYRRRKVLIKYIPEGTTRLLQARTAVHFQDILERYSPYETLLEITTADALNDTSLAASFPLHTASPSASSSRLHEISEDAEDGGSATRRPPTVQSYSSNGSIFGTQRYKTEKRVDQLMGGDRSRRPPPSIHVTNNDQAFSPLSSPLTSPQKTQISQFLVRDESGQRSITSIGSQPSVGSMNDYAASDVSGRSAESATTVNEQPEQQQSSLVNSESQPSFTERSSTIPSYTAERQNSGLSERSVERPSISEQPSMSESVSRKYDDEPYDFSKFEPKPKIKLGPRPVAAGEKTKRPTVASISAIPANFRPAQKKQEPSRPQSQRPVMNNVPAPMPPVLPAPPPIPDMPEYTPRPVSRGSVKSLPSHKSTAMTPDKIRLMKAVELRKKQMRKSNPQAATFVPPRSEDAPAIPKLPEVPKVEALKQSEREMPRAPEAESHTDDERQAPSKKVDSGIEMSYERAEKRSEDARKEEQQADEPREPPADSETLAKLQPSPKHSHHSLRLETASPASTQLGAAEEMSEPTVSLDMLESAPNPALARLRDPASAHSDSPTLGRDLQGLGITTPPQQPTMQLPEIVTTGSTRPNSSNGDKVQTYQPTRGPQIEEADSPGDSMTGSGTLEPPQPNLRRNVSDLARRRRGIVEPLHVDASEEGFLSSDDELMEELHTATFQEAKPMTMARSPVAASFPRRPSAQSSYSDRSVPSVQSGIARRSSPNMLDRYENASDHASLDPSAGPARAQSFSTTPPYERADPLQGLKRNVSTGITQRIHKLAEASSPDLSLNATPRATSPEIAPQATWRERKSYVRSPPRSRTSSWKSAARQSDRLQQSEITPVWNTQQDPTSNRDSVSVSARIVRPAFTHEEKESTQAEAPFQQPQLTINHKRASAQNSPHKALPPLTTSMSIAESAPSITSPSPPVTRGSTEHRTLHSASAQRKSFGRYKQQTMSPMTPSAEDFPPPPMQKTASRTSVASSNEEKDVTIKESNSRTSRFFKRMSNLGGGGGGTKDRRRSGQALPVAAEAVPVVQRNGSVAQSARSDMPPAVVVGDLNVQFPDSLLWKRRIISIDQEGNLLFAVPQAMEHQRGTTKRFQLSEFMQPYIPDLDRQELPHSVMLDFKDGVTTLQAACEDSMTQRQVLRVLRSYWKAWVMQT